MTIKVLLNPNWFKRHLKDETIHPHNFKNAQKIHKHLHFMERMSERLLRKVTLNDIDAWISQIERGESHLVEKQPGRREVHLLFTEGKTIPVIYGTHSKTLVTVLPMHALRTSQLGG